MEHQKAAKKPAVAHIHLTKFVCLDCQSCFKRPVEGSHKRNWPQAIEIRVCPSCGSEAYLVGSDFKAPRKSDDDGWKIASFFISAGMPYFRLYEAGEQGGLTSVGEYPREMTAARAFARKYASHAMPFFRFGKDGLIETKTHLSDTFQPVE